MGYRSPEIITVVGGQWGDEGKGKIVDYFAQKADVVIRAQGGDNAGHTIKNPHGKFALHLVPAGIFNPDCINIIGASVALNPVTLMEEMDKLSDGPLPGRETGKP
jgi:adenylosuccinate synthase